VTGDPRVAVLTHQLDPVWAHGPRNLWMCCVKEFSAWRFRIYDSFTVFSIIRGGADKSLARPTSRCRRMESVVS